jgi:hypothetical protein
MEQPNVIEMLDSVDVSSFHTEADRYAAKEAARRLLARLETPFERGWTMAFETSVLVAGLQVGLDLGIWERWALEEKSNNRTPQKLHTIISWCNDAVEENVIRKFETQVNSMHTERERAILPTYCCSLSS